MKHMFMLIWSAIDILCCLLSMIELEMSSGSITQALDLEFQKVTFLNYRQKYHFVTRVVIFLEFNQL